MPGWGFLDSKRSKQTGVDVTGDAHAIFLLIMRDGMSGLGAYVTINRAAVVTALGKCSLNSSIGGATAVITLIVIALIVIALIVILPWRSFTRGVIPHLRALIVVGGICGTVIVSRASIARTKGQGEGGTRTGYVILPVMIVVMIIMMLFFVMIIFIFGL